MKLKTAKSGLQQIQKLSTVNVTSDRDAKEAKILRVVTWMQVRVKEQSSTEAQSH